MVEAVMIPLWLIRRMVAFTLVIGLGYTAQLAWGHDHARPNLDKWFEGLTSGRGRCCDGNEATKAAAGWDMKKGLYVVQIEIDGKLDWYDVPPLAVIKGPNLAGHALVWWTRVISSEDNKTIPNITCFLPGTEG